MTNSNTIKIRLFAMMREAIGKKSLLLEVQSGMSVHDLLIRLTRNYPVLDAFMFKDGQINPQLVYVLNGEQIDDLEKKQSHLKELAIVPPSGGGSGSK